MRSAWVLGVVCLGVACSPTRPRLREAEGTTLARSDDVLRWELLTRPDTIYLLTLMLGPTSSNRPCPAVTKSTVNPALTLYTGHCTDEAGRVWHGEAERLAWKSDGNVTERATFRGYGSGEATITGRTWWSEHGSGNRHFFIDVEMIEPDLAGDPQWVALRHRGALDDGVWRGHGRVAVDGWGRVATRSEGLVFDESRCKSEPLSGKTTLSAAGHEVEIAYDGATHCDQPGTAAWRYDGEPRGELTGVSGELGCTPSENGDKPPAGAWLVLLSLGGLSPRLRRPRAARR